MNNSTLSGIENHPFRDDDPPTEKLVERGAIAKVLIKRKAYLAALEIVTAFRDFIATLQIICVEFRNAINEASSIHGRSIIPEEKLDGIFGSMPNFMSILNGVLMSVELHLTKTKKQITISHILLKNARIFKLHVTLNRDVIAQIALLEKCIGKYPRFRKALHQFELGKGNTLKNILSALKPLEQLDKYRILLGVYLNYLDKYSKDYQDTQRLFNAVDRLVCDERNRILQEEKLIQLRLRFTDIENQKICKEGPCIIKEGRLFMVSKKNTIQQHYFILMSDSLICASFADSPFFSRRLRLRFILPLYDMEIDLPLDSTGLNLDFTLKIMERSVYLSATSTSIRDEWTSAIKLAISNYKEEVSNTPFGRKAPIWIPDNCTTKCQICAATFRTTCRRHHCRACGKVICRKCSSHSAKLEFLEIKSSVRVCIFCFLRSKE